CGMCITVLCNPVPTCFEVPFYSGQNYERLTSWGRKLPSSRRAEVQCVSHSLRSVDLLESGVAKRKQKGPMFTAPSITPAHLLRRLIFAWRRFQVDFRAACRFDETPECNGN